MLINKSKLNSIAGQYYDDIYRFCLYRLKNSDDAKDITQEVFLLFKEKENELIDNHIRSWLFSVAERKIKEEYKRRKRDSHITYLDELVPYNDEILTEFEEIDFISDEEIEATKAEILSKLSPDEQLLFKFIYQEKLKYNEIARLLGVSEKTINVRAFRMRLKITKMARVAFLILLIVLTNLRKII